MKHVYGKTVLLFIHSDKNDKMRKRHWSMRASPCFVSFFHFQPLPLQKLYFSRKKYKEFFREKFACLLDGIFVWEWEWKIQVDKAELFVKEISSCHLSFFLLGLFSKLLVIYQAWHFVDTRRYLEIMCRL